MSSIAAIIRPAMIALCDLRYGAFLSAILIYAFLGSPTPDTPGWPEAVVGGLLACAVGISGAWAAIKGGTGREEWWFAAGRLLLVFGITFPLLVGAMRGNAVGLMLRDLAPFLFLILPVFLYGLIRERPGYGLYMLAVTVVAGLIFAARSLGEELPLLVFASPAEPFYFANAPTVLFAALALIGIGGSALMKFPQIRPQVMALLFLGLAALPLTAMAMAAQRASLGAVMVYAGTLLGIALYKRPAAVLPALTILGVILWMVFPALADISEMLVKKSVDVGFNMRMQEAAAVWRAIAPEPGSLLFGLGWGGLFESPAVGDLSVNFTHGLLTSMLLKTGLCGLGLVLLYLAGLGGLLVRLVFRDPVIGLALTAPILIDVFLYASFKSLDFGLVLLLIPAMLVYRRAESAEHSGVEGGG